MKKKFLSRLLTMLLVVSMALTLLPVPAMAADGSGRSSWSSFEDLWNRFWNWDKDDTQTTDETANYAADSGYYRIVHLDCGRKYFSKDWIIALMTEAKAAGYNQIQLAFGNKGLRFLLNDMTVTVGDTAYTSDSVRNAIQGGNKAYNGSMSYNPDVNELTQSEMDAILAAAETIGIEVVPLFNTPFHMEAVISAMESLQIGNAYTIKDGKAQKGCLNLETSAAVGFVKALMQKYVTYFKEKGCKYFSFGADEYTGGWNDTFYSYAKDIASMITQAGMTPRVFNDSYRKGSSTYIGGVNEVYYWYTGWSGNDYATASTLKNASKTLINTNKDYYYVVSKNVIARSDTDAGYVFSGPYDETTWVNKATSFNKNTFNNWSGSNTSSATSDGSMFCIWCDNPGDKTETEVAKETRMILRVMAARMQDSDSYQASSELVDGGFDADGNVYHKALTVTGEGVTASKDEVKSISVAANKEITLTANEVVTWKYNSTVFNRKEASEADVAAYAAEATYAEYTGRSITLIPTGTADNTTVTATNESNETVTINVTVTEAKYTPKEVWVSVGGTSDTFEHEGTWSATGGDSKIATANVENTTGADKIDRTLGSLITDITSSKTGVFYVNGYYLTMDSNGSIGATQNINDATEVTVTKSGSSYKIQANNYYLGIKSQRSGRNTTYTLTSSKSTSGNSVNYNWLKGIGDDYYQGSYQILAYDGGWTINTTSDWGKAGKLYSVTETATPGGAVTKVSFTGVAVGETTYIVGDTKYTVHVSNIPANADKLYVDFWVTSTPVTPNGITTTDSGSGTARRVYATYNPAEFNMEAGVLLSEKMPKTSSYTVNGQTFTVSYWKTRYLPNECRQMAEGWTNKNGVGTDTKTEKAGGRDIEAIRYWDSKWEYRAVGSKEWVEFTTPDNAAGAQIAAYYLIKTDITNEVTTSVTDWTDNQNESFWGVALDFCVKYPSSTDRVPDSFGKGKKTQWFNCLGETGAATENGYSILVTDATRTETVGSWEGLRKKYPSQGDYYRVINYIDVTEDQGYEVYMITATPSTSFNDASSTNGNDDCPDEISYTGTERVLWAESNSVAEDSGLEKHSDYKVGGDPVIERVMIQQCSGMLLTYYVRPKEVKNPLTVHFRVNGSDKDFASYQIAPKTATAFDAKIALPSKDYGIGELDNATILNDKGVQQTVTSDLTQVPGVPAKYRRTTFKCVALQKKDDLTEIYLYYTFNNSAVFVIDFGLPLKITPGDVNDQLNDATITSASASSTNNMVQVDVTDPRNIVITPTQAFVGAKDAVTFNLEYTGTKDGKEDTASYLVTILPASNVLYEEDFLTAAATGTGDWTKGTSAAPTTAQETQKVGEGNYNVFGYDDAYASSTGASGVWQLGSATEEGKKLSYSTFYSNYLSTTFYGNGFDLIGDCGPDTGRVLAILTNNETRAVSVIDVDTRYKDGSGTTLHQVPLLHKMLTEGTYSVKIYGGGLNATTVSETNSAAAQSGIRTQAMALPVYSYDAMLESVLQANGLSMADVEYIKADTTAASAAAASTNGIATYAAAADTKTVAHEAGTHVEIDGFRVYRSTNTSYPAAEQDVTYTNVIDALNGEIVAYTEADGNHTVDVKAYEAAGGPQNEIYLAQNQMLIFALEGSTVDEIQVSLRAVGNQASVAGLSTTAMTLNTSTEMYYTLKSVTTSTSGQKVFIIANSNSNDILAVGNFKFPKGVTTANIVKASDLPQATLTAAYSMALNAAPVEPEQPEQPPVFAPEQFDASVSTTRFFRSKLVTLTVKASADVAKLTVNGRELRATNSWMVQKGWSDTYIYVLTDTVKKNESRTYEVVAYDANGSASAAKTLSAD